MSRFYKNHLKKLALLTVMLVLGFLSAYSQWPTVGARLKLNIECEGIVVVKDFNTGQTVITISGPSDPGDFSVIDLTSNQKIILVTDPTPLPQFQVQGVEIEYWDVSDIHVPPPDLPYPGTGYTRSTTDINYTMTMGGTGSQRIVYAKFKIKDPNVTMTEPDDVSTVTYTPVIIPITATYPDFTLLPGGNPYLNSDILVDARIETSLTGGFPDGAEIIKVSLDGGLNNIMTSPPYSVEGETTIYLSEVLGIPASELEFESGKTLYWEITVAGVSDEVTVPITVTSIGYKDFDNKDCHTDFSDVSFNVTWADSQVTPVVDIALCWDDCIEFDYVIEYPTIENLDTRIMNDAKIMIYKSATVTNTNTWDLNSGAEIEIFYNGTSVNNYELSGDYHEFYLSALLNDIDPPTSASTQGVLNNEVGIQIWTFEICGANPGNYYVVIDNFAELDGTEYVYDGDEFLVQYVGALGVTMDPIADIETATNAPVIFEASVYYPQTSPTLAEQNLDPNLLIDAVITVDPVLPANTTVAEIQYNGTVVPLNGQTNIGGVGSIRLSEILGSAPTLLSGHTGIVSDTWKISIEYLDVAGTYSVTLQSVTSLDFDDVDGCYSVMAEQEFTVTMDDLVIDPIADIYSITKTPVIIPVDVQYPAITPYDNTITVDAKISTVSPTTVFPAETYVRGVSLNGGVNNLIVTPYNISGLSSFLLSDVLGLSPGTFINENGKTLNWEILVISHTTSVTNVIVESIVNYPLSTEDFLLDSQEFTLTYAEVTIDEIADATVCHPDDIIYNWCVEYPLVQNVGGNRVLSDGKFSFYYDADLTQPLSLPIGTIFEVTTPVGNVWTSTLTAAVNTIYGSAVVAVQSGNPSTNEYGYILPLERPASTQPACWQVRIIDAPQGTVFVKFEEIALLDWPGTSYFGTTYPFGPHGTFEEFTYEDQDWKVIYVGADGVTMDIEPNAIETVTGAPVVFDVEVAYGDLASQNIDPSVLVDALILFDTPLPVGAEIVELLYNGGNVGMVSPTLIGGVTNVLLSDIIGLPAAVLAGHHNRTDTWKLTVAGVDEAGTYTATIQSIAYVDYDDCYSVMAEDEIVVTWDNMCVSGDYADKYCLGDDVEGVVFYVFYPAISNNPAAITTDALLSVNNAFPVGSVISWTYTDSHLGVAQGTYTVPSPTPITEIRLSEIVGGSAPTPLQGHDELNVTWTFDFIGLPVGLYYFDVVPVATLDNVDYELENECDILTYFYIYPYPAPEITGDSPVFSGSETEYSVDNVIEGFTDVFAPAFWYYYIPEDDGSIGHTSSTLTITGPDGEGLEEDGVEAYITFCYDGLLTFDYNADLDGDFFAIQKNPSKASYLVYKTEDNSGTVSLTVNSGDMLCFVVGSVTNNLTAGVATITNWNFEIEGALAKASSAYYWQIVDAQADPDANPGIPTGIIPNIDGSQYGDGPDITVDVPWPWVGTYTLTLTVTNCGPCATTVTKTITVLPNLLVGQVKYYNALESPIPSPFNTNVFGMTVPDYFYVSLVSETFTWGEAPYDDLYYNDDIYESKKVEEYYGEDGHPLLTDETYEAAFAFSYNLNPEKEYRLIVWDGGYFYDEKNMWGGMELGMTWSWNNWGGVNATDALLNQHMGAGHNLTLPSYNSLNWLGYNAGPPVSYGVFADFVADVNFNGSITALDALLTARRAIGLIYRFPNDKPNFAVAGHLVDSADFNTPAVFGTVLPEFNFDYVAVYDAPYEWSSFAEEHLYTVTNTFGIGNQYLNIYYNAVGDINASYVPAYGGFKAEPNMELIYDNTIVVNKGDEVTIPVSIDRFAELGALSIGMTFRNDLIEVIGLNYGDDFAYFNQEAGTIRIAWSSTDGITFNADDNVALITVRILDEIPAGTRLFELDSFTELANRDAQVIEDVNLKSLIVTTDASQVDDYTVANYPNPFNDATTISYTMPEAGAVSLVVYNHMGQIVRTYVNGYQDAGAYHVTINNGDLQGPGVYYYTLKVKGESEDFTSTNSMILVR